MKEFLEKNGGVIQVVTGVASFLTVTGAYVVSLIKSNKREIRRYKQVDEEHQQIMKNLRGDRGVTLGSNPLFFFQTHMIDHSGGTT